MKKLSAHFSAFLLLFVIFMPLVTGASISTDLIVCDGAPTPGSALPKCDFAALVHLAQNVITLIIKLGTVVAVALAVVIGFQLITSGGNVGAKEKAKKSAMALVKGYFWVLIAWLVVYTITNALLGDGYSILGSPTTN